MARTGIDYLRVGRPTRRKDLTDARSRPRPPGPAQPSSSSRRRQFELNRPSPIAIRPCPNRPDTWLFLHSRGPRASRCSAACDALIADYNRVIANKPSRAASLLWPRNRLGPVKTTGPSRADLAAALKSIPGIRRYLCHRTVAALRESWLMPHAPPLLERRRRGTEVLSFPILSHFVFRGRPHARQGERSRVRCRHRCCRRPRCASPALSVRQRARSSILLRQPVRSSGWLQRCETCRVPPGCAQPLRPASTILVLPPSRNRSERGPPRAETGYRAASLRLIARRRVRATLSGLGTTCRHRSTKP